MTANPFLMPDTQPVRPIIDTNARIAAADNRLREPSASLKELNIEALFANAGEFAILPEGEAASAGSPSDYLFCITNGAFKVKRILSDGRCQIIGFAMQGDVFGNPFSDEPYDCSLKALTKGSLLRMPRNDFVCNCFQNPRLQAFILAAQSNEIKHRNNQAVLLGRKTAEQRLANFLIEQFFRTGLAPGRLSPPVQITLVMSRRDIANYLGLTIETVSRTLSQFRQRGLICISQTRNATLLDVHSLMKIAGDCPGRAPAPRLFF